MPTVVKETTVVNIMGTMQEQSVPIIATKVDVLTHIQQFQPLQHQRV